MKHKLSIILALLISFNVASSTAYGEAESYGTEGDALSPGLACDRDFITRRSTAFRQDVIRKLNPGAIGKGYPLEELSEGKFPREIPIVSEPQITETVRKIRLAVSIAVRLHIKNRGKIPDAFHGRSAETLKNLVELENRTREKLYLFLGIVESDEDYLLGFNYKEKIGLSIGLVNMLYDMSPKLLAQYIYHECVPERINTEGDDHKDIYSLVQKTVFGEGDVLELKHLLRNFITNIVNADKITGSDVENYIRTARRFREAGEFSKAFRYFGYALEILKYNNIKISCSYKEIEDEALSIIITILANEVGIDHTVNMDLQQEISYYRNIAKYLVVDCMAPSLAEAVMRSLVRKGVISEITVQRYISRIRAANSDDRYRRGHINILAASHLDAADDMIAIHHLKMLIRRDPSPSASIYSDLGLLYKEAGKFEEAYVCFRKAMKKDPEYETMCLNMSDFLAALGQYQWAIDMIDRGLDALNKKTGGGESERRGARYRTLSNYSYHNRGNFMQRLGLLGEAHASFRRALNYDPDDDESDVNLMALDIMSMDRIYRQASVKGKAARKGRQIREYIGDNYLSSKLLSERKKFIKAARAAGSHVFIQQLRETLFSSDKTSVIMSAEALGEVKASDYATILALINQLSSSDPEIVNAVRNALISLGKDALFSLHKILRDPRRNIETMPKSRIQDIIDEIRSSARDNEDRKIIRDIVYDEDIALYTESDFAHKALIFKYSLINALENVGDSGITALAIDEDLCAGQKAQIMPLLKLMDELREMKQADGSPLFPNLRIVTKNGGALAAYLNDNIKDGDAVFLVADKRNIDRHLFDKFIKRERAWVSSVDNISRDPFNYMPITEAAAILFLSASDADAGAIKALMDEISNVPVSVEDIQRQKTQRYYYILPKIIPMDPKELRRVYERLREVYLAA